MHIQMEGISKEPMFLKKMKIVRTSQPSLRRFLLHMKSHFLAPRSVLPISANLTSNNMVVFQMPDGAIIEKQSSLTINIRKFESNFLITPKSVFNPGLNNYYICEFMKCKISANFFSFAYTCWKWVLKIHLLILQNMWIHSLG